VRRAVLAHAAERAAQRGLEARPRAPWRPWRRPAIIGTLAAAALAGLLVTPYFLPRSPPLAPPSPATTVTKAVEAPARAKAMNTAQGTPAASGAGVAGALRMESPPAAMPGFGGGVPYPSAALGRAAEIGDQARLMALLDARADINARDANGRTALMLAILHGQAGAVDVLLAHGADPNAADSSGITPLQAAVAGRHTAIVAALQRAGAR
jgi:hypothetical protein